MQHIGCPQNVSVFDHFLRKASAKRAIYCQHSKNKAEISKIIKMLFKGQKAIEK